MQTKPVQMFFGHLRTKEQLLNSKVCVLPYTHIATHPDGNVTLCCESDKTNGMDRARNKNTSVNLNWHSPNEVLSCGYYKEVREQMENGQEPKACTKCYELERRGAQSKRVYEINEYFTRNTFFSTKLSVFPEFIELRLGNTCTLKCITCNPISSSSLRPVFNELKELQFIPKSLINPDMNVDWTEKTQFWDDLFRSGSNIKKIYINGGEPTLIKQHWRFLTMLVKSGQAKNIHLQYNINLTQMKQEWLELWAQFKRVDLGMSIDDIEQRNEYIRFGSKWDTTLGNLKKVVEFQDGHIVKYITQTISALNAGYIDTSRHFFMNEVGVDVVTNVVTDPFFMNPSNMPARVKDWYLSRDTNGILVPHLSKQSTDSSSQLVEYLDTLEKKRSVRWREVFKEFADVLTQ